MRNFLLLAAALLLLGANANASHFLGAQESSGFGGHDADCGQSFKGPFRGLGDSYGKRPFSSVLYSTVAITLAPTYILSTTSECLDDAMTLNEREQIKFIAHNRYNISQEMAQGGGEYLNALAGLMGCSSRVFGDFGRVTQAGYELLFNGGDATSTAELLAGLKRELRADPKLASSCSRLS